MDWKGKPLILPAYSTRTHKTEVPNLPQITTYIKNILVWNIWNDSLLLSGVNCLGLLESNFSAYL